MDTIPTLVGSRGRLRPLQAQGATALLEAASDGRLWELEYTVVPSAETVESYIATARRGRDAGTVLPFMPSGRRRNSVVFSITDAEWPRVSESLARRLAEKGAAGLA